MKRKGDMIFWEISELSTTKEKLAELGFADLIPRNDHKTALIKALKEVLKGDEKDYERFNDKGKSCHFAVLVKHIEGNRHLGYQAEINIRLEKESGVIYHEDSKPETAAIFAEICDEYQKQRLTINSNQFRSLVIKAVKEAYGVSVRSGGGVYYIDERFDENRVKLERLFQAFPGQAMLSSFPVYDNESTLQVIENGAYEEVYAEIETLVRDTEKAFKERKITKRQLEGKINEVEEIFKKISVHKENLRARAEALGAKALTFKRAVDLSFSKIEEGVIDPADFMKLLGEL